MRIYLESSIGCSREKKERFIRLVDTLNGIYLPLLCSSAWWTPWTGSWPLLCSPAFNTLSTVEPTCLGILTLFKCCHPCWVWITYLQLYKEIIWNLPFYWEREVSARIDLILVKFTNIKLEVISYSHLHHSIEWFGIVKNFCKRMKYSDQKRNWQIWFALASRP